MPFRNKIAMVGANEKGKDSFKSIGHRFGDDFVVHIARAYGLEVFDGFWVFNFGDEGD